MLNLILAILLTLTGQGTLADAQAWLPPCEHEDSDWCYWDAGERGNGEGTSFVALGNGVWFPLDEGE